MAKCRVVARMKAIDRRIGEDNMTADCSALELQLAIAGSLPPDREESTLPPPRPLRSMQCRYRRDGRCQAVVRRSTCRCCAPTNSIWTAPTSREDWSEVDFTVEHLEPSDQPNVLGRLGGYDVLEIIGRGGMGIVLKGLDRELKRCVAIKVLAPHLRAEFSGQEAVHP